MAKQEHLFEDDLREKLDAWHESREKLSTLKKEYSEAKKLLEDEYAVIVKELSLSMREEGKEHQDVTLTNGQKKSLTFKESLQISDFTEEDDQQELDM